MCAVAGQQFKMSEGGEMARVEAQLADGLSDIRFTDTNRVPFPFQKKVLSFFFHFISPRIFFFFLLDSKFINSNSLCPLL